MRNIGFRKFWEACDKVQTSPSRNSSPNVLANTFKSDTFVLGDEDESVELSVSDGDDFVSELLLQIEEISFLQVSRFLCQKWKKSE